MDSHCNSPSKVDFLFEEPNRSPSLTLESTANQAMNQPQSDNFQDWMLFLQDDQLQLSPTFPEAGTSSSSLPVNTVSGGEVAVNTAAGSSEAPERLQIDDDEEDLASKKRSAAQKQAERTRRGNFKEQMNELEKMIPSSIKSGKKSRVAVLEQSIRHIKQLEKKTKIIDMLPSATQQNLMSLINQAGPTKFANIIESALAVYGMGQMRCNPSLPAAVPHVASSAPLMPPSEMDMNASLGISELQNPYSQVNQQTELYQQYYSGVQEVWRP